jgi:hypothetical protein
VKASLSVLAGASDGDVCGAFSWKALSSVKLTPPAATSQVNSRSVDRMMAALTSLPSWGQHPWSCALDKGTRGLHLAVQIPCGGYHGNDDGDEC